MAALKVVILSVGLFNLHETDNSIFGAQMSLDGKTRGCPSFCWTVFSSRDQKISLVGRNQIVEDTVNFRLMGVSRAPLLGKALCNTTGCPDEGSLIFFGTPTSLYISHLTGGLC